MAASKYNEALLGPIVASSKTLGEVLRRLGLPQTGGNYRYIAARVRFAGLDTTHFRSTTFKARCAELTRAQLEPLVAEVHTVAQLASLLGLPENGRATNELAKRLDALDLDTSHFRGRGWNRGETMRTHPSVARVSRAQRRPDHELFVENAPPTGGKKIARRLIELGTPNCCSICGINAWLDKPLSLHLDHINGINNDNRRENLRLLCPNCHSQTDTYCRRRS